MGKGSIKMYQPTIPALWSSVNEIGFKSSRNYLHTNGTYVRAHNGYILGRESFENQRIFYYGEYNEKKFAGFITDRILVTRIKHYWDNFIGKYHTNCASFAHYLTTGDFVECEKSPRYFVLTQGMRPYEMANRVDIGDMMCLLYAHDKILRSRTNPFASKYKKAKKHRHNIGGFNGCKVMDLKPRSFTAEEIYRLYNTPLMRDFHFMVCVAKRSGRPVWLSQGGHEKPGNALACFSVTYDDKDPYLQDIPVFTFIKKRR